jgi:hypothetical protein
MDDEIEELKELVQKDIELNAETNKMVHQMRRSARWGMFFQILYWLLILGAIGASYYYVSPYAQKVFEAYQNLEHSSAQSQNLFQSFQQTFGKLLSPTSSSTGQ